MRMMIRVLAARWIWGIGLAAALLLGGCQPGTSPEQTENILQNTLEAEVQGTPAAALQTTPVPESEVQTGVNSVSVVGSVGANQTATPAAETAVVPRPIEMNLPLNQAGISQLDEETQAGVPQFWLVLVGGIPGGADQSQFAITLVFPSDLEPGVYELDGANNVVQLTEAFGAQYTPPEINPTDYNGTIEVLADTVRGQFQLDHLDDTATGTVTFTASISAFVDEGPVDSIGEITVEARFETIEVVSE